MNIKSAIFALLLLTISIFIFGYDYPTVPYTFGVREVISSAKTNANNDAWKNAVSDGTKKTNFAEIYIAGTKAITDTRLFYGANELHVPGQYATIQAAITAATTASTTTFNIVIDGAANSTATASIPTNVKEISFRPEGYLNITGQLTFTGQFINTAPRHIFKGTGTVTGNITNSEVYPEFWGVDGTADNIEVNKATLFCYSQNGDKQSIVKLLPYRKWYFSGGVRLWTGVDVIGSSGTVIEASADGISLFYTTGNVQQSTSLSVQNIRIKNSGSRINVIAFDLYNARHNVRFDRVQISGGDKSYNWTGFRLSKLNWKTRVTQVEVEKCYIGIEATDASCILNFIDCATEYNTYGFYLHYENGDSDVMTVCRITGTVCQNNTYGIYLRNTSNIILDGIHFENNAENDITGVSANSTTILACEFRGNIGKRGMKFTTSGWVNVVRPLILGQRNDTGVQLAYDFDSTNFECFTEHQSRRSSEGGSYNEISSTDIVTGIYIKPQYSYIAYGVSGTTINVSTQHNMISCTVPSGGITLTYTGQKDGQEFNIILRTASSYATGNIQVFGSVIDLTGIAASKNKILKFIYSSTYSIWLKLSEGPWQ